MRKTHFDFDIQTMGKRIKERRASLGIPQNKLAELIGISNNHLSNVERGLENLSMGAFVKMCNELSISPDYFILGAMHGNNVKQNIYDSLRLCSDRDVSLIKVLVDEMVREKLTDVSEDNSEKYFNKI